MCLTSFCCLVKKLKATVQIRLFNSRSSIALSKCTTPAGSLSYQSNFSDPISNISIVRMLHRIVVVVGFLVNILILSRTSMIFSSMERSGDGMEEAMFC
jgi:hypothetical protein